MVPVPVPGAGVLATLRVRVQPICCPHPVPGDPGKAMLSLKKTGPQSWAAAVADEAPPRTWPKGLKS